MSPPNLITVLSTPGPKPFVDTAQTVQRDLRRFVKDHPSSPPDDLTRQLRAHMRLFADTHAVRGGLVRALDDPALEQITPDLSVILGQLPPAPSNDPLNWALERHDRAGFGPRPPAPATPSPR
jgi:hypothetical protein